MLVKISHFSSRYYDRFHVSKRGVSPRYKYRVRCGNSKRIKKYVFFFSFSSASAESDDQQSPEETGNRGESGRIAAIRVRR